MIFIETAINGVWEIQPELIQDDRGFFARTFCEEEFRMKGLECHFVQCSISFNTKKGTVRGLHWQSEPFAETKLVRCTKGRMFDVAVDVRAGSTTRNKWLGVELSSENRKMLYIPPGFAHGFQTLEDDTEVSYQISQFYHPESARGIRWDDPTVNILWPIADVVLSVRDSSLPYLKA